MSHDPGHLLALHKAVLLKLEQPQLLDEVVAIDGQLPGGCYRRSWAIVNATGTQYLELSRSFRGSRLAGD